MANLIELELVAEPVGLFVLSGHRVVSTNVGMNGEILRLFVEVAVADNLFAREGEPGGASFLKTKADARYRATLVVGNGTVRSDVALTNLDATAPMVEAFADGAVLVVAPRCRHFNDGTSELNARLFCPDGTVDEFCLGDGIEHIQIDGQGRIWVGYFDEGVFGNYGWGVPDGPEPIGSSGLACFDRTGKRMWEFGAPDGLDQIVDCYALNVTEDCVWACYYTDFPIVRIDAAGKVEAWQTDLSGPRELAIAGDSVLAFGGYGEHRNDCVLLRLSDQHAEILASVKLVLPNSVELSKARVIGRGSNLYIFNDDTLFKFEVPLKRGGATGAHGY